MIDFTLQLNPGKAHIMLIAPPSIRKEISIHGVNLPDNICVRFKSSAKHFGIMIDGHLSFRMRASKIKRDCFRLLRNVCRRRLLFRL